MQRFRRQCDDEDRRFCSEFRKILAEERTNSSSSVKRSFPIKDSIKTLKLPKDIAENTITSFSRYFTEGTFNENANLLEMFDLAAAFCHQELMDKCIGRIRYKISRYDPLELFNLGNFHACEELKKMSFAIIQKQFPDLKDEYINAPNFINTLMTSIQEIDMFMPTEEEFRAQMNKNKIEILTTKLQKLLQKTTMTVDEQK